MSSNLGQTFYGAARAPLDAALKDLNAGRIVFGLRGLRAEAIMRGWKNGVELVSVRASAKTDEIEQVIPSRPLAKLLEQQEALLETLTSFDDQLQRGLSMAPGVSASQAEENLSGALARLASRYQLDKQLAEPLTELSALLRSVEQALERARDTLANDKKLMARLRRRLLVRVMLVFVTLLVIAGAGGWYAWTVHREKSARARVQALLDATDPCAVEQVQRRDERYVTASQKVVIEEHTQRCHEQRERLAHVRACARLQKHLSEGHLDDKDRALAHRAAELLERVASHALVLDDLRVQDGLIPCQDTPSGRLMWDAVADELGRAANLWGVATSVSDHTCKLLLAKPRRWTERSRKSLAYHAEMMAKRAVKSGRQQELQEAAKACSLLERLKVPRERNCRALANLSRP